MQILLTQSITHSEQGSIRSIGESLNRVYSLNEDSTLVAPLRPVVRIAGILIPEADPSF